MKSASSVEIEKGFSEWVQSLRETLLGNTIDAQELL